MSFRTCFHLSNIRPYAALSIHWATRNWYELEDFYWAVTDDFGSLVYSSALSIHADFLRNEDTVESAIAVNWTNDLTYCYH